MPDNDGKTELISPAAFVVDVDVVAVDTLRMKDGGTRFTAAIFDRSRFYAMIVINFHNGSIKVGKSRDLYPRLTMLDNERMRISYLSKLPNLPSASYISECGMI